MKLTQEDIEKFKYYADNKIRLKLAGQNYIGQTFETEGFIIYDHNNPDAKRLEAYSLAIFQGRYLDSSFFPGAKKDYVLFFTEPAKNLKECLYIESIHTAIDSKLVFTNPDFSDIISRSIEENQEAYKEGQNLNDASRELLQYVGEAVAERNLNFDFHLQRTIIAVRCTDNCQGKKVTVTDCFNPGSNILTGPRRKMVLAYSTRPKDILGDATAGMNLSIYEKNAKQEQEMERK